MVPVGVRALLCFLLPGGACSCSPQRPTAAASFLGMLSFSVPRSTEITAPPVGSRLGGQSDSLWPRTKGSETLKGPQGQQRLDNKIRPGVWGAGTWNMAWTLLSAISCQEFHPCSSTGVASQFAGLPNLGWASSNVALKSRVVVCSLSRVQLWATPWTVACQALSMGFPRREYWRGLHFLLQGIFLTQGSNLCFLHCRWILYHWATWEAPV